ncbi:MAG: hypothetical protein MPN21_02630 [Thermoanaerobaculia bacterium]|nr:hypothetical protein [Thermoanaerobaculia bacterium]
MTDRQSPESRSTGSIPVESFATEVDGDGWSGEFVSAYRPADLNAALDRLMDPGAATQTVHWGRNYLYRTSMETDGGDRLDVVVKQFRNLGLRKRLDRKLRGSKAWRSWKMSRLFAERGIPTADPVFWIESSRPEGPSFFVCRHLPGRMEARLLFRAANTAPGEEGSLDHSFPSFDFGKFLEAVASALRRMHEAGLFHRDLSIGNVLLPRTAVQNDAERLDAVDLDIIDLNRARDCRGLAADGNGRPGLWRRSRDLCRLTIFRPAHRQIFLDAYWRAEGGATPLRRLTYYLCHWGFYRKINLKKRVRAPFRRIGVWLKPRRAHVHIPDAPRGASARDKIVWDHLSDQPHQHAARWEKLKVRLADLPAHLRGYAALAGAIPRIATRYRRLQKELYRRPVPWQGAGVCLRPYPADPDLQLRLLEDLGLRHVLLRLHPWQENHDAEEDLARTLHDRGYELTFALPQNRDLVRHPALWRRRVEELARRFVPYGRHFQVGQAINRSKWGVWVVNEYLQLARDAAEILRRVGTEQGTSVEVLGPAVIDFEVYSTASVLNLRGCPRFDAVASLLYVDRRGAPENRQLGFDSVDKVLLVQAIAETARSSEGRSWITEVNWPLWEGPHSPAGKSVSVSELRQADYLARFYLLALTTGRCERVFWWQLVARGYGLTTRIDPEDPESGLRLRPSFHALRTLEEQLRDRTFLRPIHIVSGNDRSGSRDVYLFLFSAPREESLPDSNELSAAGEESMRPGRLVVGWCLDGSRQVPWPIPPRRIVQQDGSATATDPDPWPEQIEVGESVRYFHL